MEILSIRLIYILQLVLRLHLPLTHRVVHVKEEAVIVAAAPGTTYSSIYLSADTGAAEDGGRTTKWILLTTHEEKDDDVQDADQRMSLRRRRRGSQPVLGTEGGRVGGSGQSTCLPLPFRRHVLAGQPSTVHVRESE